MFFAGSRLYCGLPPLRRVVSAQCWRGESEYRVGARNAANYGARAREPMSTQPREAKSDRLQLTQDSEQVQRLRDDAANR